MIEKFCNFLTNKIRKTVPEITDEKAEIINYGLQNIVGEIPKIFIFIGIAYLFGIGNISLLAFLIITPYRSFSGGFHLHTHIGCIVVSTLLYSGTALLGNYIVLEMYMKYILIAVVWLFGMIMIKLYAPADTENVPILRKKDRKKKKILSYITLSITLIIALIIKEQTISNIIIFGMLFQTITITRIAYKITNNKYGYEVYEKDAEGIQD